VKILGLLDTLESVILEGFKIPLTKKTVLNEDELLGLLDKMRVVIQEQDRAPERIPQQAEETEVREQKDDQTKAADIVKEAYEIAKEVRVGADRYADEVLSNLELTTSRILRTVRAGRTRLVKTVGTNISETEEKIKV
jgi:cell division septum initiation protein DivIVA